MALPLPCPAAPPLEMSTPQLYLSRLAPSKWPQATWGVYRRGARLKLALSPRRWGPMKVVIRVRGLPPPCK